MDKLKNSFALGILLGLASASVLVVILDALVYFIGRSFKINILEVDVVFALSIILPLLLARKYIKGNAKPELSKGFLFSSFVWGAAYVYLFHISPIKSLFFIY